MYKAVLIDIDNTLLDFNKCSNESMHSAAEKLGVKLPGNIFELFRENNDLLWAEVESGKIDFETLKKIRWNTIFSKCGIVFDGVLFETEFRIALNESAIPIEGAEELLEYLHGKYSVYAASNGPYGQQTHRLQIAGMAKYFDGFFISGDVGFAKPSAYFFSYLYDKINRGGEIIKEEIIMIGDSIAADIEGAKDFGFATCYIKKYNIIKESDKADYTVEELSEITEFL